MTTMTREQMVANDKAIAEASARLQDAISTRKSALDSLHHYVDDKSTTRYYGRQSVKTWSLSTEETLAAAREGKGQPYNRTGRERYLAAYEQAEATRLAEIVVIEGLDEVWRANGMWNRFYLVPGGHIHRSDACHSLKVTTMIGWLPELAGLTEKDAVDEYGAILCTHCFPSAPVEWTNKYELEANAKKASQCPGSGNYDYEKAEGYKRSNAYRRYQVCAHCGTSQSVTSTGKMRAHKAK